MNNLDQIRRRAEAKKAGDNAARYRNLLATQFEDEEEEIRKRETARREKECVTEKGEPAAGNAPEEKPVPAVPVEAVEVHVPKPVARKGGPRAEGTPKKRQADGEPQKTCTYRIPVKCDIFLSFMARKEGIFKRDCFIKIVKAKTERAAKSDAFTFEQYSESYKRRERSESTTLSISLPVSVISLIKDFSARSCVSESRYITTIIEETMANEKP